MGGLAIEAIHAEYVQLNDQKVYEYTDQDALTQDQKDKTLNPTNLVKVKRDGQVKGRSCVDGRLTTDHNGNAYQKNSAQHQQL